MEELARHKRTVGLGEGSRENDGAVDKDQQADIEVRTDRLEDKVGEHLAQDVWGIISRNQSEVLQLQHVERPHHAVEPKKTEMASIHVCNEAKEKEGHKHVQVDLEHHFPLIDIEFIGQGLNAQLLQLWTEGKNIADVLGAGYLKV